MGMWLCVYVCVGVRRVMWCDGCGCVCVCGGVVGVSMWVYCRGGGCQCLCGWVWGCKVREGV